jgi:HAD hydrolase, family IA, variant 3
LNIRAKALLFDLDDTLVRSTPSIESAWKRFSRRHQLPFEAVRELLPGRRGSDIVSTFFPAMPHGQIVRELALVRKDELESAHTVEPVNGAAGFLADLTGRQWAVVTAAPKTIMMARLNGAGLPAPEIAVCAEDVSIGKPSPEGFLTAARRLGANPSDCLGFEDSSVGFAALETCGTRIIEVFSAAGRQCSSAIAAISDYSRLSVRSGGSWVEIEIQ